VCQPVDQSQNSNLPGYSESLSQNVPQFSQQLSEFQVTLEHLEARLTAYVDQNSSRYESENLPSSATLETQFARELSLVKQDMVKTQEWLTVFSSHCDQWQKQVTQTVRLHVTQEIRDQFSRELAKLRATLSEEFTSKIEGYVEKATEILRVARSASEKADHDNQHIQN